MAKRSSTEIAQAIAHQHIAEASPTSYLQFAAEKPQEWSTLVAAVRAEQPSHVRKEMLTPTKLAAVTDALEGLPEPMKSARLRVEEHATHEAHVAAEAAFLIGLELGRANAGRPPFAREGRSEGSSPTWIPFLALMVRGFMPDVTNEGVAEQMHLLIEASNRVLASLGDEESEEKIDAETTALAARWWGRDADAQKIVSAEGREILTQPSLLLGFTVAYRLLTAQNGGAR